MSQMWAVSYVLLSQWHGLAQSHETLVLYQLNIVQVFVWKAPSLFTNSASYWSLIRTGWSAQPEISNQFNQIGMNSRWWEKPNLLRWGHCGIFKMNRNWILATGDPGETSEPLARAQREFFISIFLTTNKSIKKVFNEVVLGCHSDQEKVNWEDPNCF